MLFNSWLYMLFLGITLILYWNLSGRFRTPLLLIASYFFYMSWSPPFGLIYGPVIFLDSLYFYGLSKAMVKWPSYKKGILYFGIITELCLLAYFKYASLLLQSFESILAWFHLPSAHLEVHVFLPLAISFTNFILISYLVDVYRGEEKPSQSFIPFATYVAFFPHLIAGPIVRAKELLSQMEIPKVFQQETLAKGIQLFLAGLFLKMGIADAVAPYVNEVYAHSDSANFSSAWVGTYGFAIQIFCDFAGYTAMAQGSALMMGITLPENFNAPYFAANISDFWRRWHMSLSRWLRDYLYIPLGGSRRGAWKTYGNLFLTMALGGLWHGAAWTFMAWGILHGLYLSLHKAWQKFRLFPLPAWAGMFLTFHAVCLAWVFFRAPSFADAFRMLSVMFNPATYGKLPQEGEQVLILVGLFLVGHAIFRKLKTMPVPSGMVQWGQAAFNAITLMIWFTTTSPPQEFIYFQF